MNNLLRSKTRLTNIQLIFQHYSTNKNIDEILDDFKKHYKNTIIESFHNKKKIKIEFNSNFLNKLINFYKNYISEEKYILQINQYINFERKFEKWDTINQSILLAILSEVKFTDSGKTKIVLNDYLNIAKSFINQSEVNIINAILDKIINEKK